MEERSRRIVEAAIELAETGGFEGVRLRDVASQADVALGTLYRRFRSKEELLIAALELEVTRLEQRMAEQPLVGANALDRVGRFFRVTTRALCARQPLARALVRAVASGGPDLSARIAAFHERMETMIIRSLRGGGDLAPLSELERRIGQTLLFVWFAALAGWASGLHGVDAVVDITRSAAGLVLSEGQLARTA